MTSLVHVTGEDYRITMVPSDSEGGKGMRKMVTNLVHVAGEDYRSMVCHHKGGG